MKNLLLISFILFFVCFGFSQSKNQGSSMYSNFDKTIGTFNTKLSYGVFFEEKFRKRIKNNHNCFLSDVFQKGNIHYRGEDFFNAELKYDIVNDIIIARITNQEQKLSIILEKNLIDHFQIHNHNFVNTFPQKYGFLEKIAVFDNFSVLKKHQKSVEKNTNENYVYHTFEKEVDEFYLHYNNQYFPIESRKDFIKIFPEKRKQITSFFNDNSSLKKNNYKTFVIELMNQLEN